MLERHRLGCRDNGGIRDLAHKEVTVSTAIAWALLTPFMMVSQEGGLRGSGD